MKTSAIWAAFIILINPGLNAQEQGYIVRKTSFCSEISAEFSPVAFGKGLVFVSDRSNGSPIGYKDQQKGMCKIYYVEFSGKSWKKPTLFSPSLSSPYHDGPVTFCDHDSVICYSRNNDISARFGNVQDTANKLGLFTARFINGNWTDITPVSFGNSQYNFTTPSFSPDGKRLYFASDMPGGYGATDIYYCEKTGGGWSAPVHPGPEINTAKNESFPFASEGGKLFFSSDGHAGFGGKDIYYTEQVDGKWIEPVHLDSAINSTADDFGFSADSSFTQGYFSSNRYRTDDIFTFKAIPPDFSRCDTIRENDFCFTFYDDKQHDIDTISSTYAWDFGNGRIVKGKEVRHCFSGPGHYTVKLTIMDDFSGKPIGNPTTYYVDLENVNQAGIVSINPATAGQPLHFTGITRDLTGFTPHEYWWDFGNGFRPGGASTNITFNRKGKYDVRLGMTGSSDSSSTAETRCFLKTVLVFNSIEEINPVPVSSNAASARAENDMKLIFYVTDNLSAHQKQRIADYLKVSRLNALSIDKQEVSKHSSEWIKTLAEFLRKNPDIGLQINIFTGNNITSDSVQRSVMLKSEFDHILRSDGIAAEVFVSNSGELNGYVPAKDNQAQVAEIYFMTNPPFPHE
jgi:hypothetical protein